MGDEAENSMNLDLNLGPLPEPDESLNLDDWLRVTFGLGTRRQRRSFGRQPPVPPETRDVEFELMTNNNTYVDSGNRSLLSGEASVTPEERDSEITKTTENNDIDVKNEELGKKQNEGKGEDVEKGSFFDCNICLDLANDPVVTCCGHLFCWPCLYQWLHLHSDANECPVCKGSVAVKNIIPIYGRGNNNSRGPENNDPGLKIPNRPKAKRIESLRQAIQRNSSSFPMEEMIRRLGNRFDVGTRHMVDEEELLLLPRERSVNSNVFPRSRRMRRDHHQNTTSSRGTRFDSLWNMFHEEHQVLGRNEEQQIPPLDDRDSVSSIAAVILSESQTVDTAVEIDSNVSISTSTSRRRNFNDGSSRVSDVDSGDSRANRRRRLN